MVPQADLIPFPVDRVATLIEAMGKAHWRSTETPGAACGAVGVPLAANPRDILAENRCARPGCRELWMDLWREQLGEAKRLAEAKARNHPAPPP